MGPECWQFDVGDNGIKKLVSVTTGYKILRQLRTREREVLRVVMVWRSAKVVILDLYFRHYHGRGQSHHGAWLCAIGLLVCRVRQQSDSHH